MSDFFKIDTDWNLLRKNFEELKDEVSKFLKVPNKKHSGVILRKKSIEIRDINLRFRNNVLRKRKEYQSDYS